MAWYLLTFYTNGEDWTLNEVSSAISYPPSSFQNSLEQPGEGGKEMEVLYICSQYHKKVPLNVSAIYPRYKGLYEGQNSV